MARWGKRSGVHRYGRCSDNTPPQSAQRTPLSAHAIPTRAPPPPGTYLDEEDVTSATSERRDDGLTYYTYEINAPYGTVGPHTVSRWGRRPTRAEGPAHACAPAPGTEHPVSSPKPLPPAA